MKGETSDEAQSPYGLELVLLVEERKEKFSSNIMAVHKCWRDADSMTCKKLGKAFSLAILEYGRREAGREVYKMCVDAATGLTGGETEGGERSIESQATRSPKTRHQQNSSVLGPLEHGV